MSAIHGITVCAIGGAIGWAEASVMLSVGVDRRRWQFWAILGLMSASQLLGAFA